MAGDAFIIFQTKVAREGERRSHRAKGREGDREKESMMEREGCLS